MIIATSRSNLDLRGFTGAKVEIIYLESEPTEWTDIIPIFEVFLSSSDDTLLLDTSRKKSFKASVARYKTVEYFDCFDVSHQSFSLSRFWIKSVHALKLIIFNLLFGLRFFLIDGFLSTRVAKIVIRAKAIQRISNLVGAPEGIRVNYISKNLTTLIFSRKAASYFVDFNTDNIIDVDSVLRSTLRSSNLSFGALQ
jgi:hypothetical protein